MNGHDDLVDQITQAMYPNVPKWRDYRSMGKKAASVVEAELVSLRSQIERLQDACEYEAMVTDVHLGYATFPKTRRPSGEAQVRRLRILARGGWPEHYSEKGASLRVAHLSRGEELTDGS